MKNTESLSHLRRQSTPRHQETAHVLKVRYGVFFIIMAALEKYRIKLDIKSK